MLMLGADTFVAVGLDFGCCSKVIVDVEHKALTDVNDGLVTRITIMKLQIFCGACTLALFAPSGSA